MRFVDFGGFNSAMQMGANAWSRTDRGSIFSSVVYRNNASLNRTINDYQFKEKDQRQLNIFTWGTDKFGDFNAKVGR